MGGRWLTGILAALAMASPWSEAQAQSGRPLEPCMVAFFGLKEITYSDHDLTALQIIGRYRGPTGPETTFRVMDNDGVLTLSLLAAELARTGETLENVGGGGRPARTVFIPRKIMGAALYAARLGTRYQSVLRDLTQNETGADEAERRRVLADSQRQTQALAIIEDRLPLLLAADSAAQISVGSTFIQDVFGLFLDDRRGRNHYTTFEPATASSPESRPLCSGEPSADILGGAFCGLDFAWAQPVPEYAGVCPRGVAIQRDEEMAFFLRDDQPVFFRDME